MRTTVTKLLVPLTVIVTLLLSAAPASAAGYYVHDPMENPKAAADIVVDPSAVYGYAPNPDSPRLGVYARYDWSDEDFVAEMRQQREEYHESIKALYQIKADMETEGKSVEEIARAVSTRRNEIRMEAYQDDPEGLEQLRQSNLETYGNENGGTPDYFYAKYGSWETVIEKAFATNAGADAILGLYDLYYDTYIINSADENGGEEGPETPAESPTDPPAEDMTAPAADAVPDAPAADASMISPRTGDRSPANLWIGSGMICAALCGFAALSYSKKRG